MLEMNLEVSIWEKDIQMILREANVSYKIGQKGSAHHTWDAQYHPCWLSITLSFILWTSGNTRCRLKHLNPNTTTILGKITELLEFSYSENLKPYLGDFVLIQNNLSNSEKGKRKGLGKACGRFRISQNHSFIWYETHMMILSLMMFKIAFGILFLIVLLIIRERPWVPLLGERQLRHAINK